MELTGNRRHPIIFRALFLINVLILSVSIPAVSLLPETEAPTCDGQEFLTEDNICCQRCHAGYKLVENCPAHGYSTKCKRCPPGQYLDQINYSRNCFSCKRCKENNFEVEDSPCTHKQNTVCRCMDGYYKSEIDSVTYECLECSTCGNKKCPECQCKNNYYRVKSKCLPCTNCTDISECSRECPPQMHQGPPDNFPFLVNVIAGAAVVLGLTLVLVTVVTYFVTKRQTERRLLSPQEYKESPKIYEELPTYFEEPSVHSLQSVPLHTVISQEPSNLPDCIPLEIKVSDVIYTLLELVPVLQVKQLVRSLGVSDTVIERAELDHRSSREAHYQMLRAWTGQGSPTSRERGGQGGVLHLPLLQQLLDKLRLMHLEQTAQELETKYNVSTYLQTERCC